MASASLASAATTSRSGVTSLEDLDMSHIEDEVAAAAWAAQQPLRL